MSNTTKPVKKTKTTEDSSEIKTSEHVTTVHVIKFSWGDPVEAIYINDILVYYNDFYHGDPKEFINGISTFAATTSVNINLIYGDCTNTAMCENITNYGGSPPKTISELSWSQR